MGKLKPDTALLLIDVINDLNFPGNEELLADIPQLAENILSLKKASATAGLPIIYLNDNFEKWRSDLNDQLKHCLKKDSMGKAMVRKLKPNKSDFFILKPMQSGFFGTPLQIMLHDMGIKKLILTGLATDICVMYTANDAYMRGFKLIVASDATAANTRADKKEALKKMEKLLKAKVLSSEDIVKQIA